MYQTLHRVDNVPKQRAHEAREEGERVLPHAAMGMAVTMTIAHVEIGRSGRMRASAWAGPCGVGRPGRPRPDPFHLCQASFRKKGNKSAPQE
jgi:hypothetical protein